MKKLFIVTIVALMSISFSACQNKFDPKKVADDFSRIIIDNQNDCDKMAKELSVLLDTNQQALLNFAKEEAKAGRSAKKALTGDRELQSQSEDALVKCVENEALNKVMARFAELFKKIDSIEKK